VQPELERDDWIYVKLFYTEFWDGWQSTQRDFLWLLGLGLTAAAAYLAMRLWLMRVSAAKGKQHVLHCGAGLCGAQSLLGALACGIAAVLLCWVIGKPNLPFVVGAQKYWRRTGLHEVPPQPYLDISESLHLLLIGLLG